MLPAMVSATQLHLPSLGSLPTELAPALAAPRPEALALVRQVRQREQTAVAAWLDAHLGEATGVDVVTTLTAITDAVVRVLVERAFRKAGAPDGWQDEAGVFAVGGYGRGEMNPHSDLDLMVVSRGAPPPWLAAAWQELQTLCWDAKFQLGGSQRAIPELEHILAEDFVTATALIEQRPLVAGGGLAAALSGLLDRFRSASGRAFLRFKLAERAKRGDPVGAALFLMEPNLKNNPGGLRDVQLLRNLAFILYGGRTLFGLEELSSLTRADLAEVARANDHLLRLRSLLHFHHGRKQDVLQLPDQVRIARQIGYGDVSRLRAVEHFMRDHYRQIQAVHQALELAIARARAKGAFDDHPVPADIETAEGPRRITTSSARIALLRSRTELDQDFCAVDGMVFAVHERLWTAPDWVGRVFAACRSAQGMGLRLSYELQRSIRARLFTITDEVRSDRSLARTFLDLIGDLGRASGVLTDLHDSGLLGAWLPEFGNLNCLMQFDSWHQYTVDRHTLLAMRYLDEAARGEREGLPGMRAALNRVRRRDLLALGLLLHDMGKYMGRGHVARGAMMVAQVAKRLGLDTDEEDFLHFLVDRHVALSDASRMRDFHEPAFLRAFAERMGDVDRLDALYVLTYCDAKAVGDGVLTGWQEAILGELYDT
ncbi:MAG: nitrogen regulatory protein uridylyltransferase, GlnD, partial [Planctomycetota bacterium]